MNKKMIKLTAALMAASAAALSAGAFTAFADEDVYLTDINFPDKTFRDYVRDNFDGDNSGTLTQDEIENAKYINVRGMEITSLRGVEFLTALTTLDCSDNSLTSLYLSENTALTTLDCSQNSLTSLNVSSNTELQELICSYSGLTSINVSGCSKLAKLWCSDNSLTALDLSGCTAVNSLDFNRNSLTSLDISDCTGLEYIYFEGNQLTSLDVSNNSLLKKLDCTDNRFTSIDISGCPLLDDLRGSGQTYSIGAVEGSYSLSGLPTGFDPGKATDWTGAQYDGTTNSLKSFTSTSVSYTYKCDNEQSLSVTLIADSYTDPDAGSVEINDTNFPDGTFKAYVSKEFDTNSNGKLSPDELAAADYIYVSSENITSLKGIEHFTAARSLYCNNNSLTELDVSKNTALETLSCSGNQLTALDVSHNSELKNLDCQNNKLTSLDLSHNPALTELNCCNNSLASLDVSGCTGLESLACDNNKITELDLSKNTALSMLVCESNGLTKLNISGCNALTLIQCRKNSLTSLDVSGCKGLAQFSCDKQTFDIGNVKFSYSLSGLPEGFDSSKASDWTGAAYDSGANRLKDFTAESVTYVYDCGNKKTMDVTLKLNYQSTLADVEINATNFPDTVFRTYISDNFDNNPTDGKLSELEINAVKFIDVRNSNFDSSKDITDMTGIGYFTALETLYCGYNRYLTTLDLRNNTRLTVLDCYQNSGLQSIDLTGCMALKTFGCKLTGLSSIYLGNNTALESLDCTLSRIDSLDLSNNPELKILHTSSLITSLDLSNNTKLNVLYCNNSKLTSLELSNNTELKELNCAYNDITSLDLSNNTALTKLDCYNNKLTSLDLSKNNALTGLFCYNNKLTSLDLSKNTALTKLHCSNNQLTSLDVSGCTALTSFKGNDQTLDIGDVSGSYDLRGLPEGFDSSKASDWTGAAFDSEANTLNTFTEESVTYNYDCGSGNSMNVTLTFNYQGTVADVDINDANFPDDIFRTYVLDNIDINPKDEKLSELEINAVTEINVYEKGIADLKGIEHFTALTLLNCSKNKLASLDVSKNTLLNELHCDSSTLISLDVSGCTALETLRCGNNQLTGLDVSSCTALISLECSNNQLTVLDVSSNTALTSLTCNNNQLTVLDISKNIALKGLYCHNNQLKGLDVRNNTELASLRCESNQLTSLDLSNNAALNVLTCYDNQLASLDVSGKTAIDMLFCYNNQLASLNVSGCTALERLYCENNRLTSLDVSGFTSLDRLRCNDNQLESLNVSDCTALAKLTCGSNRLTSLDVSDCTALTELDCGVQSYDIGDVSGTYNLSRLPKGFDPARASSWSGASYDSGANALKNFYAKTVTYIYDCGNGNTMGVELTLNYQSPVGDVVINEDSFPDEAFRTYVLEKIDNNPKDGRLSELEMNRVTEINVYRMGIADLKGIEYFTALEKLGCSDNQLTSLDLSGFTALTELKCADNRLTSLNVSGCTALTSLYCYDNRLTSLDVSRNTALKTLKCYNNRLTSLDLSRNADITDTDLSGNSFYIGEVTSSYDLRNLPGSFDSSRASDWQGAVCGNGILRKITSDTITYTYDCGRGISGTFTLTTAINSEAPVPAFVDRLYTTLLGRTADEQGKTEWVNEINGGRPAADVASGFVLSEELKNQNLSNGEFIDRMYRTLLDREADEAGRAEWVSALDKGCSYGYILSSFTGSQEFISLCAEYGITAGAYTTSDPRDVNLDLTAFVSRMYTKALGRAYDIDGLNDWTNDYLTGAATANKIAYGFIFSPEFVNRELSNEDYVDTLYRTFFDREPDPAGRADWISTLEDGTSREDVLNGFLGSQEFENLKAGFNV